VASHARALETHLIDFTLQPLWTCARHTRQRRCRKLFGSSAHCWTTGRTPSRTMTREKKQVGNSIQEWNPAHIRTGNAQCVREDASALLTPNRCMRIVELDCGRTFQTQGARRRQPRSKTSDAEHAAGTFTRAWVALVLQVFGSLRPGAQAIGREKRGSDEQRGHQRAQCTRARRTRAHGCGGANPQSPAARASQQGPLLATSWPARALACYVRWRA
jgi:hypothetical protein